jgi:YVTN family beta-propeller protein
VSVIDGETNSVIKTIPVGASPTDVAVNPNNNLIYVANVDSNTVSVIDGETNEVVLGVIFSINLPDSGHISCIDGEEIPTNEYRKIKVGDACKAEANNGFIFSSWTQNLGKNSSRTVSASKVSYSPFNFLLGAFGYTPSDDYATLTIPSFGNFTANFKELPPPIPSEYLIPLYGAIISSIVGWSIPSIIGWAKSKKENRRINWYHKQVNSLYDDGTLDQNDIKTLDRLKADISDAYAKGKLSDQHYQNLKSELSVLYEEVYRKRNDSLNGILDRENSRLLYKIKNDIEDAYAKGKISDQHYDLLNKKLSLLIQ